MKPRGNRERERERTGGGQIERDGVKGAMLDGEGVGGDTEGRDGAK